MLDVAAHEEKEGAEGVRLGRASFVDEILAAVITLVGAGVMFIALYAGLCIIGLAFVSLILSITRAFQSGRARREYQRINSHLVG
jgi:hypothetical protein